MVPLLLHREPRNNVGPLTSIERQMDLNRQSHDTDCIAFNSQPLSLKISSVNLYNTYF